MDIEELTNIAAKAAQSEAIASQLPGRLHGPADAYRHILWVAELTRRRGRFLGEIGPEMREMFDFIGSDASAEMDRWNNKIGYEIGLKAKTWDDVVRAAHKSNLSYNLTTRQLLLVISKW